MQRQKASGASFLVTPKCFWGRGRAWFFPKELRLLSRAKIDLDLPDMGAPEQHLRSEIGATQERNRAYRNRSLDAGMRLERPFTEMITGMIGITGEVGRVKRAETNYRNRLIGFPVEMRLDASNDLIDPRRGAIDGASHALYRSIRARPSIDD